jgi:hypothetical protein
LHFSSSTRARYIQFAVRKDNDAVDRNCFGKPGFLHHAERWNVSGSTSDNKKRINMQRLTTKLIEIDHIAGGCP